MIIGSILENKNLKKELRLRQKLLKKYIPLGFEVHFQKIMETFRYK